MNLTLENRRAGYFQSLDKFNIGLGPAPGLGESSMFLLDSTGTFSESDIGRMFLMKDGDQVLSAKLMVISEQPDKTNICSFDVV